VAVAALLEVVDVVPTLLVEAVGHHRCAEQIAHLAAGHAGLDLVDRRLIEEIALLDVDAVDAGGRSALPCRGFRRNGNRAGIFVKVVRNR
jgi:hypothetical protein